MVSWRWMICWREVDGVLVVGGERDGRGGISGGSSAGDRGNQLALSKLSKAAWWRKGISFAT